MNRKQRNNLIRILIAAFLAAALGITSYVTKSGGMLSVLFLIPYLLVGYDILLKAGKGIKNRQPMDECLLMAVATLGAIALAIYEKGDFTEAIAVMLFYQVGEWFQSYAVDRSRRNVVALMDICPENANLEMEDGSIQKVDPEEVEIGSTILIMPGERIPIDGVVVEGRASLDAAALTGESAPRSIKPGERAVSGCISLDGVLRIKTEKAYEDSTVARVMELIEDASSRKAKSEKFISRFARVFTPIVVGAAATLAALPPLILLLLGMSPGWSTWIYRALIFLVISCPCALVVSVPLSFFAGIGGAGKRGVLIKGANYLEQLSRAKIVVFDKTGTLTEGVFQVTKLLPVEPFPEGGDPARDLLRLAATAEQFSTHPIAVSLRKSWGEEDLPVTESATEIPGLGIHAKVDGEDIWVGNAGLMEKAGITSLRNLFSVNGEADFVRETALSTVVHVARGRCYLGRIEISDVVKPHSAETIREIKEAGVEKTVMLTGDREAVAGKVAAELGIDCSMAELLPQDKVSCMESLIAEKEKEGKHRGTVAFVGDGINDAPVLSRADVGIAMGAMGSDAAVEAADIVLMDDDPLRIATAIRISRKCMRIVNQNIWFAIGVKVACMLLGAVGIANMWLAIFADVGVMVLAVLNAIRCMFLRE